MRCFLPARWTRFLFLLMLLLGLGGCGYSNFGHMDWIQPHTTRPRVGTAIMIRGWTGVFSKGIDEMAKTINEQGGTALVYMPEQYPELAAAMKKIYKDNPDHEPICFVGHSRGVDSSLIIARELDKVNVPVDMIACLDSVDEVTVPKNVRVCHNYWMGDIFGTSNLLRGIPLFQAPGSTGKLFNYDVGAEYSSWRGALTDHVSMDDDGKLQKHIVDNVLEVCVERSKWRAPAHTSN